MPALFETHQVIKGDTLYSLAKKYDTTVKDLVEWNGIPDANKIVVGQTISVSGPAQSTTTSTNVTPTPTINNFGLLANSEREVYVSWKWSKISETDHYVVRWYYSWGVGEAPFVEHEVRPADLLYDTYSAPEYAKHVSVYVKAVAKKYKDSSGKEVSYWADTPWSTKKMYAYEDNPPIKPSSTPTVEIKDNQMTVKLTGVENLNASGIEFEVVQDNNESWITSPIPIQYDSVTYICDVDSGSEYKVRARSVRDGLFSDWTAYSGEAGTAPSAPGSITVIKANSSTSVQLEWEAVAIADSYEIEYTTKMEYFDSSNQTNKTTSDTNRYILTGLETGTEYFFRVRAVNNNGESAWTEVKSIILGKKPSAPTTWSSTTTAIVGEPLILYWVHNSEDGSKQTSAILELDVGGTVTTHEIAKETNEEEEETTSFYEFDTSGYIEGTKLKWRVKTCGVTGEYSDWSMQRVVDIYARPTLILKAVDTAGTQIRELVSFPFRITGKAGPNTQTPIGYHVTITANEGYETVDHIGNKTVVNKNGVVYSGYFDINTNLDVTLSANDVDFENNITYTITCVVTMNSGLTAESTTSFTVAWEDIVCVPNASISIDENSYSAMIMPFCEDINSNLIEGITLAVYRREFDGSFVEIARNIENARGTFVTDPHPALDYARYRIVATAQATGAVSYYDIIGTSVGATAVIIQWDEAWTDFDVTEHGITEMRPWSGSLLKLPYNIDVSSNTKPDVSLVEYIGRKRPVSYYGTQLGESATWNVEIDKRDVETIYALRRLSAWMGDVYVREPSGTGYWANITVSMSQRHLDVTIPVTLTITRVEGGI